MFQILTITVVVGGLKSGTFTHSGVTRALIGGGGIFIYSCSARLISFEMNLKTKKFKRNSSGRTRIYEYTPPQLTL